MGTCLQPRAAVTAASAVLALSVMSSASGASEIPGAGTDTRIPGFPDVIGEFVAIPGASAPGTPSSLNQATFLRVRSTFGGDEPDHADAVVVAQPGFASTAGLWLNTAAAMVHNAAGRSCAAESNGRCQLEVWVVQRRSNLITDTQGLFQARARNDPTMALDYYFGPSVLSLDPSRPGKFPIVTNVESLLGRPDSVFRPLQQADVPFEAEWGYETYSGDVGAMVSLIKEQNGAKNIFLAGHSQGGLFTSVYLGTLLATGQRGQDQFAGAIYLDGGPSPTAAAPTAAETSSYLAGVAALRSGAAPVYGASFGNLTLDPGTGAVTALLGLYARKSPQAESILPQAAIGQLPTSPAGDAFLSQIRTTYQAQAGMTFDPDPVPGGLLQSAIIGFLGSKMGTLDFTPVPGSAPCDPLDPLQRSVPPCPANADELDPDTVYGWLEGGGLGAVPQPSTGGTAAGGTLAPIPGQPSNAEAYIDLAGYSPSRTNIQPMTIDFAVSGTRTIYGGEMTGIFWYESARYEADMGFLPGFGTVSINEQNVNFNVDTTIISLPIYAAKGPLTAFHGNPYPLVTDYTEINPDGVIQTAAAAALTPVDPSLNSSLYNHSDFPTANDALAGTVEPGRPGASIVADTVIDWIFARATGQAQVPTPSALGVVTTR
jgi:pimeloyl-ACP methyl ester carboxylesterase